VGSPVNLTQRIQSTAEEGEVVISETVYKHVRDVRVNRKFTMMLKGVQDATTLYAIGAM
jgi:class 3 adenylate cyclase